MAKEIIETVLRINSWYVGEDCVQVMIPYKNAITILDRNGIVYHHKKGSEIFTNNYINDNRRTQFPYHSIPTHYAKVLGSKYKYTNQIFDFDQPYIRINNGRIIESFVVKDNNEALLVNKIMPFIEKSSFKTRKEMEDIFKQTSNDNEEIYYLYLDGSMSHQLTVSSEESIYTTIKNQLLKDVSILKKHISYENGSEFSRYFEVNDYFLKFIEKNIDKLDLNELELNMQLFGGKTIILIKTNGTDISIQGYDVYFISPDCYKVDSYDIPVTKYTLEQLKYLTPKIVKSKEPKIPLKLNPGITKEDLKREKKLLLHLKKIEF